MSEVQERIAAEIEERGVITFRRYMELALYCPNCGYYEREEDNIGRCGDYYTSVSVGSLFGEMLALQFAEWLQAIERPLRQGRAGQSGEALRIVEAGAHGGDLARDVLGWMAEHRPALLDRLEYWLVEPSAVRRAWQQRNLSAFGNTVRWVETLADLLRRRTGQPPVAQSARLRGIIFSNEFLDALPVRRLGWDAKARDWFEWGVALEGGRFVWSRIKTPGWRDSPRQPGDASSGSLPLMNLDPALQQVLPDGFTIESSPAAEEWWRTAAAGLGRGRLLMIDYGLLADELLVPERKDGTLRAYRGHRLSRDVLASPGEQDITAHVNLAAIQAIGESAGLRTEACLTQGQFLTAIAARAGIGEGSCGKWTPERARQLQTLVHPNYLGQSFRVLVQSRGLS